MVREKTRRIRRRNRRRAYEAANEYIFDKFRFRHIVSPICSRHMDDRKYLSQIFSGLGYKVGAEIGVRAGTHAKIICDNIPGVKLYCVDPWEPYNRRDERWARRKYKIAVNTLKPYNTEIVRKRSVDAAEEFENASLDFVYIDARHEFDFVMMDLIKWAPKVRSGGIISGHDYKHARRSGVVQAVDAYVKGHAIAPVFITYEALPSFFWVQR